MRQIVEVHHPGIKGDLLTAALTQFFEIRETSGLKKKPSQVLGWLKLLLAEDMTPDLKRDGSNLAETTRRAAERTGRTLVRTARLYRARWALTRFVFSKYSKVCPTGRPTRRKSTDFRRYIMRADRARGQAALRHGLRRRGLPPCRPLAHSGPGVDPDGRRLAGQSPSGTVPLATGMSSLISFWTQPSYSSGAQNAMASPSRPARAMRPIRCT